MRRATLGLALVACQPVVYDLLDGDSATEGTTGPVPTTMSDGPGPIETSEQPPGPTSDSPAPSACFDGLQDGDETDIDCGGACPPCLPGGKCERPEDCVTGECFAGECLLPPQCVFPEDCGVDPCHKIDCQQGQCIPVELEGFPCDDGDPCTDLDTCLAGACTGVTRDCSEFDEPCRLGFCNPLTGACALEFAFDGAPCEDGQPCTLGDSCVQGTCVGKQAPASLFTEFNEPQGWQFAPPWEIGPAAASECAANGFEDPPEDHSPGRENMLAGAVIGGCLPEEPLPEQCLTSPELDLTGAGVVILTYWSKLSAAPVPGHARVEVWDQKFWAPVFSSLEDPPEPSDEAEWTMHSIDLTQFVNNQLKVRFCHQHMPGLPSVSGWSVDDVYIGPPECQPP